VGLKQIAFKRNLYRYNTEMIKGIMDRHNNVVPMIARGVLELKLEMAKGGGGRGMGKKGLEVGLVHVDSS
jgi:hypothetical protein